MTEFYLREPWDPQPGGREAESREGQRPDSHLSCAPALPPEVEAGLVSQHSPTGAGSREGWVASGEEGAAQVVCPGSSGHTGPIRSSQVLQQLEAGDRGFGLPETEALTGHSRTPTAFHCTGPQGSHCADVQTPPPLTLLTTPLLSSDT